MNPEFKSGVLLGAGVIVGVMGVQLIIGGIVYGLLKLVSKE